MLVPGLQHPPRGDAAPGSLGALRRTNRARVLEVLRESDSQSRAELARRTGLSRTTVSSVVSKLIAEGLAREAPDTMPARGGTGRPAVPVMFEPTAGSVLGISLSHDGVRVLVTDLAHDTIEEFWHPVDLEHRGADDVIAIAAEIADQALDRGDVDRGRLIGAAVAIPSPVDTTSGIVGAESVIPALAGVNVGERLGNLLGTSVRADNDANLCALAETLWGTAKGRRDVVYVKLSRGIGAGLVLNGALYRGRHGGAGELGHTPVIPDGPVCRCGNRGCLEIVAGEDAVLALVADRVAGASTIEAIASLAAEGDAVCRRALRDVGSMVGVALAAVTNLLSPEAIVVGGDLVAGWPVMEEAMRGSIDRAAIDRSAADALLVASSLGPRAEVLGAVSLVLHELPDLLVAP